MTTNKNKFEIHSKLETLADLLKVLSRHEDLSKFDVESVLNDLNNLASDVEKIKGYNAEARVQMRNEIRWLKTTVEKIQHGKDISKRRLISDIKDFVQSMEWLVNNLND